MIFADLGDLHSTPAEAIRYSHFFNSKGDMALYCYPEAKNFFLESKKVVDLACGTGASTIFSHRMTPNAEIETVDIIKTPFPEVINLLDGKHTKHHLQTVQQFLEKTESTFDVVYIVKASHTLKPDDIKKLAQHTTANGYVLQIDGDVELPEEMHKYFEPVWFDKDGDSKRYMIIVNALWKKKQT